MPTSGDRGPRIDWTLWVIVSLTVAAIVAVYAFGRYLETRPDCTPLYFGCAVQSDENQRWQLAAEWATAYLVVMGGLYALYHLLGRGRLRRFLRRFWYGDDDSE